MYDVAIAGGVEHMGHHPMGAGADPNPRFLAEKLVEPGRPQHGRRPPSASTTASRSSPRSAPTASACSASRRSPAAYDAGKIQPDLVPVAIKQPRRGWGLATEDEGMRPETTMEGLATLKTPFRPHGRVTAGNVVAAHRRRDRVAPRQRRRGEGARPRAEDEAASASPSPASQPEIMGIGPIPSHREGAAARPA